MANFVGYLKPFTRESTENTEIFLDFLCGLRVLCGERILRSPFSPRLMFTALAISKFLCYRYHHMAQKTVLIIEDEEDAAEMFSEMMRVSGYRVLKTLRSAPALALMNAEKPDLVLLDIMMPEISGLDLLRQMRRDPSLAKVPVIVVTAKGMPADIKDGMDAGASTYLTKPVGFTELKEAVARLLEKPV